MHSTTDGGRAEANDIKMAESGLCRNEHCKTTSSDPLANPASTVHMNQWINVLISSRDIRHLIQSEGYAVHKEYSHSKEVDSFCKCNARIYQNILHGWIQPLEDMYRDCGNATNRGYPERPAHNPVPPTVHSCNLSS